MPERHSTDAARTTVAGSLGRIGRYRWTICALIFFCTTINYIDRNSLSVLKTTLQTQLGWSDVDYGWITFAFTAAYAAFPSIIGTLIDRFGVKRSLSGALILWSLMAAAHGLVRTVLGFAIVRFLLGLRRGGQLPGVHQGDGHVVPAEGAGARNRPVQLGHQRGRNGLVRHRLAGDDLRVAVGLRHDRRHRLRVAVLLALGLRHAGSSRQRWGPPNWPTSRPTSRRARSGCRFTGPRSCATGRSGRSSSAS